MTTAGGEVGVEEEVEAGTATATGRADEVLDVMELVVDEGSVDVGDEVEEVEAAEASDAEDRTLGQNVLLHVCMSVGGFVSIDHGQA